MGAFEKHRNSSQNRKTSSVITRDNWTDTECESQYHNLGPSSLKAATMFTDKATSSKLKKLEQ